MSSDKSGLPPFPTGGKEIPTQGTFIKWEKIGDMVQGVALRLELSKKYAGENFVLTLRTDDGKRIAVAAPLKLRQAVEDFKLIGKRIAVMYVGDTPSKGGTIKEFRVAELPKLTTDEEDDDVPF